MLPVPFFGRVCMGISNASRTPGAQQPAPCPCAGDTAPRSSTTRNKSRALAHSSLLSSPRIVPRSPPRRLPQHQQSPSARGPDRAEERRSLPNGPNMRGSQRANGRAPSELLRRPGFAKPLTRSAQVLRLRS